MADQIIKQEHLTYLDELRESGETNMFGAGQYLQRKFFLRKTEAKTIMTYWMENFDPAGTELREGEDDGEVN